MFSRRVVCVITGASRGYGRTLAVALAEVVSGDSVFLLLARDAGGLSETRSRMLASAPGLRVETCAVDLESADAAVLSRCLSAVAPASGDGTGAFETGLLVHNAGSIGRPSLRAAEHCDRVELLSYCGLNVASPVLLTSAYLSELRAAAARHVIVNVSSLAAVQPLASLSLYCAGKAARDSFFRVLALEEAALRVLNWAPGAVETASLDAVRRDSFNAELCRKLKEHSAAVEDSARKLIAVLQKDEFKSGAHVAYRDV